MINFNQPITIIKDALRYVEGIRTKFTNNFFEPNEDVLNIYYSNISMNFNIIIADRTIQK